MKIRTILIDDERKSLESLKDKLRRSCPEIEIIAETQDPKIGIELIETHKPDLIFLDIAMPELNGFDMLSKIESPDFEIIFATAFDQYAIDAIKHCAIGYLLKPIDNIELKSAVEIAKKNVVRKNSLQKNRQLISNLQINSFQEKKIVISVEEGLELLTLKEIIYCEGDSGYTKIHSLNNKTILSSHSIGYYNKLINDESFYLVHKFFLVNKNHIIKYLNEGYLILTNNLKVPVSRTKRKELKEILNLGFG